MNTGLWAGIRLPMAKGKRMPPDVWSDIRRQIYTFFIIYASARVKKVRVCDDLVLFLYYLLIRICNSVDALPFDWLLAPSRKEAVFPAGNDLQNAFTL